MSVEFDKDRITEMSEIARKKLFLDEEALLRKLVSEIGQQDHDLFNLKGDAARDFVETVVEVNKDLLPKMFENVEKRRADRNSKTSS